MAVADDGRRRPPTRAARHRLARPRTRHRRPHRRVPIPLPTPVRRRPSRRKDQHRGERPSDSEGDGLDRRRHGRRRPSTGQQRAYHHRRWRLRQRNSGPVPRRGRRRVGDDGVVENSGSIRSRDAASAAVELNVVEQEGVPAAGLSSQLTNSGLISAPDVAVLGGAGQETVVNRGRIVGDVSLGEGNDTFTFALVSPARNALNIFGE